ncbi:MAG: copper homeostasis protein CutC [Caldilineaceae bacterium]|nr:copper homeostasis protein CutC [Caldilineaceae bacterium]
MPPIILEVCVDSIASALAAQEGGAQRIELCADLFAGGITPSAATLELARKHLTIDINVMIRPRGGDFLYSDLEFAIMQRDIEIAKEAGANGVVIGLLTEYGKIDIERTKALTEYARPLSITFHRAFDMATDPTEALETLIQLGLNRVLTSGLEPSALEGADTITQLIQQAAGRIIIMPGGGIHERNIAKIIRQTGAKEVHMSGRQAVESKMRYRNHRVSLGGTLHQPEYSQQITSAARISASLAALQSGDNPI